MIEAIQEQLEEQSDMIRPERLGKNGKENAKNKKRILLPFTKQY